MKRDFNVVKRKFPWGIGYVVEIGTDLPHSRYYYIPFQAKLNTNDVGLSITKGAHWKIIPNNNENLEDYWLVKLSGKGKLVPSYGTVYVPKQFKNKIRILVRAHYYEYKTKYFEYFAIVKDFTPVFIKLTGKLGQQPTLWKYYSDIDVKTYITMPEYQNDELIDLADLHIEKASKYASEYLAEKQNFMEVKK